MEKKLQHSGDLACLGYRNTHAALDLCQIQNSIRSNDDGCYSGGEW